DRALLRAPHGVLQKRELELDRVLAPMADFLFEKRSSPVLPEPLQHPSIDRHTSKRGLEILVRHRKKILQAGVARAQDPKEVRRLCLLQLLIGPAIARSAHPHLIVGPTD